MKTITFTALALFSACAALAADGGSDSGRFYLNGALGFNIRTQFRNLGGFATQTALGGTGGNADHFYDDGYNRVDGRALNDGTTWFWGYGNAAQVGAGTLAFNSSTSAADVSSSRHRRDPHAGVELGYTHPLGGSGRWTWGLGASVGWLDLSLRDGQTLLGTLVRTTHTYPTVAPVIPPPPYNGNSAGPGPLISDVPAPAVATIAGGAVITGQRRLDTALYGLRLGPELRVALCSRAALTLEAGLAVAVVDSDFSFTESVNIPTIGPALQSGVLATQTRTGRGTTTDGLVGGYAGLGLKVDVDRHWSLTAGGRYQHVGWFRQTVAGKGVEIDLGKSLIVTFGLGYSF